jgi:hypothetical protein
MIQEDMDNGEDTTGLCTVREFALEIIRCAPCHYVSAMAFTADGQRINVLMVVTHIDGKVVGDV